MSKETAAARKAALQARPSETRAKVKARAARYWNVARDIWHAIDHKRVAFEWKGSEQHLIKVAADMGITLVTLRQAERAGFVLKRKQVPVGRVYFEAPISKWVPLYVLECQFKKAE